MNKVILLGRLTKDVELRTTGSGISVTSFTIAVNRPKREGAEQEADFPPCVAWSKLAENLSKYTTKGSRVLVEGRIQTRNYEDSEGKRVFVTEVVSERIEFLDRLQSGAEGVNNEQQQQSKPNTQQQQHNTKKCVSDPFKDDGRPIDISEDDLPF